jgi:hypothetical protein
MYYDTDDRGGIAWVSGMLCFTRALLRLALKLGLENISDQVTHGLSIMGRPGSSPQGSHVGMSVSSAATHLLSR